MLMHLKVILEDCANDSGTDDKWGSGRVIHLIAAVEKTDKDDDTTGIQKRRM